jgi:hypothetical protein
LGGYIIELTLILFSEGEIYIQSIGKVIMVFFLFLGFLA